MTEHQQKRKEAFIDLNTLQEKLLDPLAIKKTIESIKMKYRDEERFLEFFKN